MDGIYQKNTLEHMPPEIMHMIFSNLSELDLIAVHQLDKKNFNECLKLVLKKRKLTFGKCYHLSEKELLHYLRQFKEEITSISLNGCYWYSATTLKAILKLPKLNELDLSQCKLTPLILENLLEKDLECLTITWDLDFQTYLYKNQHKFNSANFSSRLFNKLKTLHIDLPDCSLNSLKISSFLLQHCPNLEEYFIYSDHLPKDFHPISFGPTVVPRLQKTNLPNIRHVSLDLPSLEVTKNVLNTLIPFNLTQKEKFYLGPIWLDMLANNCLETPIHNPYNAEIFNIKDATSRIVFKTIFNAINNSAIKRLIILDTCAPSEFYDTLTEFCPLLETLITNNSYFQDSAFKIGLENVAAKCKYLRHLSLPVSQHPLANAADDYLLDIVVNFKNLTNLSLRTSTVSVERSIYVNSNEINPSMTDLSQETQENCSFYKVIKNCQRIEVLRLVEEYWLDFRVVPECVLASISNWSNLKELHLLNVPTIGKGWFLPVITKNCKKLETLFLSNVCNKMACTYTPALIESFKHAANLKVLSIQQNTIIWSLNFCQALENCLHLERLYVDNLLISSDDINHFNIMISHFKKLIAVYIRTKSISSNYVKLVNKKLKSIKKNRPSLSYYFGESPIETNLIPMAHRDLFRYTCDSLTMWKL